MKGARRFQVTWPYVGVLGGPTFTLGVAVAAVAVALAQGALLNLVRRDSPVIARVAGALMVLLAGAWVAGGLVSGPVLRCGCDSPATSSGSMPNSISTTPDMTISRHR